VNTGTTLIANIESAKSMEPSQRALDDPAPAPQATAVRLVAPRQDRGDAALPQFRAVPLGVVATIALQTVRPPTRRTGSSADGGHRIDQIEQLGDVVPIRRGQPRDERNPLAVGKNVMFRPGLAAIGRVRSSFFPPRNARREALSTIARARSRSPRRRNSVSIAVCNRFHTPARCHRTSRRQQVLPQPHPISFGSMFRECHCGAQTKCRSAPRGRESVSDPRVGDCVGAVSAAVARFESISRHRPGPGSSLTASLSVRRPYQAFRQRTRGRSVNFAMHS
jgi:hypothetical protein